MSALNTEGAVKVLREALEGAPIAAYSPEDKAFYRFWYGHMLDELMQPPLANIDHATARYIWNAALDATAVMEAGSEPDLKKIEADALSFAALSCLGHVAQAYRYFRAQGKPEEDFDRLAWDQMAKAVRHAVALTAREVKDPVWPYALDRATPPAAIAAATGRDAT